MSRLDTLAAAARAQALRHPLLRVSPERQIEPFMLAGGIAIAISFQF